MYQHIWTGNDLNVRVYFDDGNGNRLNALGQPFDENSDEPLLVYCFFQTASVTGTLNHQRRQETGRATQRIVTEDYQYDLDVTHFYLQKSTELPLVTIFNREQPLQLDMNFSDIGSGKTTDPHVVKAAYAIEFNIETEDNRNATGRARFTAEFFE